MSANSSIYNYLPIRLRGEIIQIGAVRLNDDWTVGAEFQIDIKPVYFRKMHYKVKKLTGIDSERLSNACGFREAFAKFRNFCGDDCVFLTWGYDDKGIMEQNIIVHDEEWDWISGWVNLQIIYNQQTEGNNNQKSLATAMEHFGIEQTRVAHDALGDAYNTALVCSHLNMPEGLAVYESAVHLLGNSSAKIKDSSADTSPAPVEHVCFSGYLNRNAAFSDETLTIIKCPICGNVLENQRWINQGDRRYMTLVNCPIHGNYLARVKMRQTDDELWTANRIIYEADDGMVEFYMNKSQQCRKRSHHRKKPGKSPSSSFHPSDE